MAVKMEQLPQYGIAGVIALLASSGAIQFVPHRDDAEQKQEIKDLEAKVARLEMDVQLTKAKLQFMTTGEVDFAPRAYSIAPATPALAPSFEALEDAAEAMEEVEPE